MPITIDGEMLDTIVEDADEKWDKEAVDGNPPIIFWAIDVDPGNFIQDLGDGSVIGDGPNIIGTTAVNKEELTEIVGLWDDVIQWSLFYVQSEGADITINTIDNLEPGVTGSTYVTLHWIGIPDDADVYLSPNSLADFTWRTAIHEFGHALGLRHPGPYNGSSASINDREYPHDTVQYSVMSYFDPRFYDSRVDWARDPQHPQTPMIYDILAIQQYYGKDTTTRLGDTIYGFHSTADRKVFDFYLNADPALTIWDAGGDHDRLDVSDFPGAPTQFIDLEPGTFSSVGGKFQNVAIAFDTWLEEAIGGRGADSIRGNMLNNYLEGGDGSDDLRGDRGDDVLVGGPGMDLLFGEDDNDVLRGGGGDADRLVGGDGIDTASYVDSPAAVIVNLAAEGGGLIKGPGRGGDAEGDWWEGIENVDGSVFDDQLSGDGSDNRLFGDAGDDTLKGGGGADVLDGGDDEDTASYLEGTTGVRADLAAGVGAFGDAAGDTYFNIENVTGTEYGDVLIGNDFGNQLRGEGGADTLEGGGGFDLLDGGEEADHLFGGADTDWLKGGGGADQLYGEAGDDTLEGGEGADILRGGTEYDTLYGNAGNDTYELTDLTLKSFRTPAGFTFFDAVYDSVLEAADEGVDTVQVQRASAGTFTKTGYTLPDNVENGQVIGTANFNLTGNALDNVLDGNAAENILTGGDGDDELKGAGGFDTLIGGADDDLYHLTDVTTVTVRTPSGLLFTETVYDEVVEAAGQGIDTIEVQRGTGTSAPLGYTLADNVENGRVLGTEDFDLRGNELANSLVGNSGENGLVGDDGADTLNGGAGYDLLRGGAHDDIYELADVTTKLFQGPVFSFVDTVYDRVEEAADEGVDTVRVQRAADGGVVRTAYTLPDNVENGQIVGAADFDLTGNELNNVLTGNVGENTLGGGDGHDELKGAGGFDTLIGGAGDDVYDLTDVAHKLIQGPVFAFFDTVYDDVVEAAGEGIDTVKVARAADGTHERTSYRLPGNVENGIILGAAAFDLIGNELANSLTGNEAANVLTGGLADDTLTGGPGADRIVYRSGDGTDTITDFTVADGDVIDLRGVAGVHALADLDITQQGADTVITLGSGLVLQDVVKDTLTAAQFLFSQAPTDIALSNASVAENSAAGTVVGALSATDADPGETFTFSLVDDAGGRFAVDGTNLVVAGALDYETATSHGITVRATDSVGNTYDEAFDVAVGNLEEVLKGTGGNDVLDVGPGNGVERVEAGGGNDVINVAPEVGTVVVDAGAGNDIINGNGSTILAFASAGKPVNVNLVSGAGFRQAVLKDLATGEVIPLQTRTGATDPQDFGSSDNPIFSPDGTKVAFQSTAQLDPAYPGGSWNIWVKDLVTGQTSLVSTNAAGVIGDNNSLATDYRVAWSPDGSKIAFTSSATNLVAGDTNGLADLFVKTVAGPGAGAIVRASEGAGGVQAIDSTVSNALLPHGSFGPKFSPDGRLLLFWSTGENLAAGDSNGVADVYLKVLEGPGVGNTYLISRDAAGTIGNGQSRDASFSPDGNSIVFTSNAANLGATAPNSTPTLFVKDISAVYAGGDPSNGTLTEIPSFLGQGAWPTFSPDGTKILYYNGQILYHDLATGTNTVVSASAAGANGNAISQFPAWSHDGTKVTFLSLATNLVPGDSNAAIDVFVKTISGPDAGAIERVSMDAAGVQGNANSLFPVFSTANPNLVAFETDANNLYVPQTGIGSDKFSGVSGLWGTPFNDILVNSNAALAFATFRGEAGSDVIQGNLATLEEVDYRDSPAGIVVTMTNDPALPGFGSVRDGWGGSDIIRVIENVRGSGHADVINMDDRDNAVWGYAGDDRIDGLGGADVLDGGEGDDVLSGGRGDDLLTGGAGADAFVWRPGDGTDTVLDFDPAEGDALDLRGVAGVHSLADLPIAQDGADTVITLGSGFVLRNFVAANLTAAQVVFSQPPTDIALSSASIAENSAAGAVVGSLSATDADAGETFTFSLVDDAGGLFALDGADLVVAGALDHEAAPSHGVTIRVTDSVGNTLDEAFVIGVTNVNEAPTGIALAANPVAENSPAGTVVGVLSGTDPDAGDLLTYSLVDDAGGLFALSGNAVIVAGGLDYEVATAHEVVVRATDAGGEHRDETFALAVTNVGGASIRGSTQDDTINASGSVAGQPLPTGEEDVINGRGGDDSINGLAGDDYLDGGAGADRLIGGQGDDELVGGSGADALSGGSGDDRLLGGDGADRLVGGSGDDVMTGGAGRDTYGFARGFGHDVITDFAAGRGAGDVIEFDEGLFAGFGEVLAASHQVGADVVIEVDAASSITLEGVALATLHPNDFDFVL